MSETNTIKKVLFDELFVGVRTVRGLIEKINEKDWTFSPGESMRSLEDLTNHLVQVPLLDLQILQEKDQDFVSAFEKDMHSKDPKQLVEILERGYYKLEEYFNALSEKDFLEKRTKPFYFPSDAEGHTQARWLTEILTHLFHHRAQVFNYLKQLGYDVSMFDLY